MFLFKLLWYLHPQIGLAGRYVRFREAEGDEKLDDKVEDLHGAEDGEAGEEPHGSAHET